MKTISHNGTEDKVRENDGAQRSRVVRAITKQSFAVLSTVSEAGCPHAVGVLYEYVDDLDGVLFVHTMQSSRKARNIIETGYAAVCIPLRTLPVGPPFSVQFQARAEIVSMTDPSIVEHLSNRRLRSISGHGALDESDGCFARIRPVGRMHTYGIGVSLFGLIRDPLHAGARSVTW
jgi:Pyridoxamine 5'-phosphate oxidase